jgi:hypothetical protein
MGSPQSLDRQLRWAKRNHFADVRMLDGHLRESYLSSSRQRFITFDARKAADTLIAPIIGCKNEH